jgi:hypothetical protein
MTGPRGLLDVDSFIIATAILDSTLQTLADAGCDGNEAFVLWSGVLQEHGTKLRITTATRPEQQPVAGPDGLLVAVPGRALAAVNLACYRRGEILAGQVHTHPTEAYHSSTDDHYPLVTLLGALSLVVPDFARSGRTGMPRWAWYRQTRPGRWSPIEPETTVVVES